MHLHCCGTSAELARHGIYAHNGFAVKHPWDKFRLVGKEVVERSYLNLGSGLANRSKEGVIRNGPPRPTSTTVGTRVGEIGHKVFRESPLRMVMVVGGIGDAD